MEKEFCRLTYMTTLLTPNRMMGKDNMQTGKNERKHPKSTTNNDHSVDKWSPINKKKSKNMDLVLLIFATAVIVGIVLFSNAKVIVSRTQAKTLQCPCSTRKLTELPT